MSQKPKLSATTQNIAGLYTKFNIILKDEEERGPKAIFTDQNLLSLLVSQGFPRGYCTFSEDTKLSVQNVQSRNCGCGIGFQETAKLPSLSWSLKTNELVRGKSIISLVNPATHNMQCILYLITLNYLIIKASLPQAWQSCHRYCILQIVCLIWVPLNQCND